MKKILAVIAMCLALTSCKEQPYTHEDWQNEKDREAASRITKFNYEGHSYLLYQYHIGAQWGVAGICHDENCECKKGGQDAQD